MRKKYGLRPEKSELVAPIDSIGTLAEVMVLYTFLTTELEAGPMTNDGFLLITDWVADEFWSA